MYVRTWKTFLPLFNTLLQGGSAYLISKEMSDKDLLKIFSRWYGHSSTSPAWCLQMCWRAVRRLGIQVACSSTHVVDLQEEEISSHRHSLNQFCHFPPLLRLVFIVLQKCKPEAWPNHANLRKVPGNPIGMASPRLASTYLLVITASFASHRSSHSSSWSVLYSACTGLCMCGGEPQTQSGLQAKKSLSDNGWGVQRGWGWGRTHNAPKNEAGSLQLTLPGPVWRFCFFSQRIKRPLNSHFLRQ